MVAYTKTMQTFLIEQKIQPIVNRYAVFQADEAGNRGAMVGFAEQKRFTLKEQFTIYTDDTKSQVAFAVKARQVMDFGTRYDVTDGQGEVIGVLGKDFKASLLNSTWHVFRPGEEQAPLIIAHERNQNIAILRRVWDFIPVISEIPFFIKFQFDYLDAATNAVVATYDKTTTVRDHYRLSVQDAGEQLIDWRVYVALGVLLDAMQSR